MTRSPKGPRPVGWYWTANGMDIRYHDGQKWTRNVARPEVVDGQRLHGDAPDRWIERKWVGWVAKWLSLLLGFVLLLVSCQAIGTGTSLEEQECEQTISDLETMQGWSYPPSERSSVIAACVDFHERFPERELWR